LFSAVISQRFSKNRMIISVVAAKIWYLKNVWFLLGHPVYRPTRKPCCRGETARCRSRRCKFRCIHFSAQYNVVPIYAKSHFSHTPTPIPARILCCSLWSRLKMLESADSEHPRLISSEIIFEVFQPTVRDHSNRMLQTDRQTDGQPTVA